VAAAAGFAGGPLAQAPSSPAASAKALIVLQNPGVRRFMLDTLSLEGVKGPGALRNLSQSAHIPENAAPAVD